MAVRSFLETVAVRRGAAGGRRGVRTAARRVGYAMRSCLLVTLLTGIATVPVWAGDPFGVAFSQTGSGTNLRVSVALTIPPGHHIYADAVKAESDGGRSLALVDGDRPAKVFDTVSGTEVLSYTNDVSLVYATEAGLPPGTRIEFSYQGCDEKACFFPQTRTYVVQADESIPWHGPAVLPAGEHPRAEERHGDGWSGTFTSHEVVARAAGYLNVAQFGEFLDRAEGVGGAHPAARSSWRGRIGAGFLRFSVDPVGFLKAYGAGWTVLVILVGGLLLNLTPCVLPMIPVNLAILGVGAQNQSRVRGFLLGFAYGSGMALVYGLLGLVVVLTGSQFGTLNSLPWFNAGIGLVFVVLSLAMFDLFTLDFSRFQSGPVADRGTARGGVAPALVMGGVMALLAGACVAPVVIAVLLLSSSLYGQGAGIGLVLPFVLGLGMALPWPLAGAGLAFLPKPGGWMTKVKNGFGIVIMLFALYYFFLAYQGWWGHTPDRVAWPGVTEVSAARGAGWDGILDESVRSGKPVFVDFWATWCKNCEAMELTTFRDHAIAERLSKYLVVKVQAEQLTDAATRKVVDQFEVKGLPSYLVLKPKGGRSPQ